MRSPVPVELKISLKLGETKTERDGTEAGDLVETDSTTHTDVDRGLFEKLPLESQSSSLSSLVTLASPGISADSNGLFQDSAITRRTHSRSTASRSPISKARSSRIRFRSMPCSRWR